jgi:hypothetical protein
MGIKGDGSMPIKINELNPGMREDRTTAEIVQIATTLADDELIICNTFLTPTMRLAITLDNRPYDSVRDVVIAIRNAENHEVIFHRPDNQGMYRVNDNPWRDGKEMNIRDIVEGFGLDDQRIEDPPSPGTWTGWFLMSYRGPHDELHQYRGGHGLDETV